MQWSFALCEWFSLYVCVFTLFKCGCVHKSGLTASGALLGVEQPMNVWTKVVCSELMC